VRRQGSETDVDVRLSIVQDEARVAGVERSGNGRTRSAWDASRHRTCAATPTCGRPRCRRETLTRASWLAGRARGGPRGV